MKGLVLLILCYVGYGAALSGYGLRRLYPTYEQLAPTGDVGEPLYLTPYIQKGRIKEAQAAAKVNIPGARVSSFAGYLTVNAAHYSNLFFWMFPAEKDPDNAPVVLWLQGGPGATSMFGLFAENGPFYLGKGGKLKQRKFRWSKNFNMIYIDNPVGTGFSFTEDEEGYATDQEAVARDLYSALSQFFQLFPNLRDNEFFVTGESYGGKYVPSIAYAIHNNNDKNLPKINLKGIAIGNGWTVPEHMLNYGDQLYQIGLIDEKSKEVFRKKERRALAYIKKGDYGAAARTMDELVSGDAETDKSFFFNVTGFEFYYNFLHDKDYIDDGQLGPFLQSAEVRRGLHVGDKPFQNGSHVAERLYDDVMKSEAAKIQILLDNYYRVLFYNGQLDIICSYPLTENVLRHLRWHGADAYKKALRRLWYVDGQLAGYSKTAGDFTEVLVRNAGHMVPTDQPKWAHSLITSFVFNKPL